MADEGAQKAIMGVAAIALVLSMIYVALIEQPAEAAPPPVAHGTAPFDTGHAIACLIANAHVEGGSRGPGLIWRSYGLKYSKRMWKAMECESLPAEIKRRMEL